MKNNTTTHSPPIAAKRYRYAYAMLLAVAVAVALHVPRVNAFSLLCGFCSECPPSPYSAQTGDIGLVANLGEEYRWNVPVLVYTFDSSFLQYFGSSGIAAVESAISILNNLPPVSQINPSNYPTSTVEVNFQAQSQGLLDLKSMTLALLLEQLGLAQPTRHIFDLRDWDESLLPPNTESSWPPGTIPGLILERNFDPFTGAPSHSVNGTLYTGYVVAWGAFNPKPEFADVLEFPLDPLSPAFPAVADRELRPGMIYTGLTRDDVGGLSYLLRTNNLNLEILLPGVHGIGTNAGAYVNAALRRGVDKITFVRRDYDSFLGQLFSPFTNQFTDTYITNNALKQQWVERVITEPDILFTATAPEPGERPGLVYSRTGTSNWWNSASLTGLPGFAGPGVIRPSVRITFQKFTPRVFATDDSTEGVPDLAEYGWGSFDNSTNPPVPFPSGAMPGNDPLRVKLYLHPQDDHPTTAEYGWQLPVPFGGSAALEMSDDLDAWTRITVVTNLGKLIEWDHTGTQSQKFYRVLPQ